MHKSYAKEKSSAKFSKKSYTYKLYVVKIMLKRSFKILIEEVMCKSCVSQKICWKIFPKKLFEKKLYAKFICISYRFLKLESYGWEQFSKIGNSPVVRSCARSLPDTRELIRKARWRSSTAEEDGMNLASRIDYLGPV